MFRWIPAKPIDYNCRYCNGTGRIAGNPTIPLLIVLGSFVLMLVCAVWWLFS